MVFSGIDPSLQPLAAQLLTSQRTGAILMGSWWSAALLGACLYQAGVYAFRFRHDRLTFKLLVALLTCLNIAESFVLFDWQFDTLITNFGDVANLTAWNFVVTSSWALITSVATCCQLFYAWRIHKLLNGSWLAIALSGFISLISVAGFATGWTLAVKQSQLGNSFPVSPLDAIQYLFVLAFVLPASADLAVMAGMFLGLRRVKKLSLPSSSHRAVSHILTTAVEVNALTTAMTLAVVGSFAANQRPIAICIGAIVPKVYQLTLVTSLLARSSRDGRACAPETTDEPSPSSTNFGLRTFKPTQSGVVVHTVRHVMVDDQLGTREVKVAIPSHALSNSDSYPEKLDYGDARSPSEHELYLDSV